MRAGFKAGERVFVTAGRDILEAQVRRARYGRYVVAYRSICFEGEGCICVSVSRMYRNYDEAAAQIDRRRAIRRTPQPVSRTPPRADEPGDGWARR